MEIKLIAKQIIDFNKATFDNTFNAISVLQDHSEKMVSIFLQKASLFPPEGKKVILEWMEACKKGKKDFKQSVDNGFKTVEGFLIDSADSAMIFPISGMIEKMDQSVKEVTNDIKKSQVEVVDESSQTIPIAADKYLKQNTIRKKKTILDGKSGTGSVGSVRKAVKSLKK
jgi:hypothetical protein